MRALIQRVSYARGLVDDAVVGEIERGILLFLAIQTGDSAAQIDRLLNKVLAYRIFPDAVGHMNLALSEISGGLLVVSQFTLAADTRKGLRPSFSSATPPIEAEVLYDDFVSRARQRCEQVATGRFGADMKVQLENDGPVTFLLEVNDL
jgi:D-tyrosyl-tRNA(Tyr) deacylase